MLIIYNKCIPFGRYRAINLFGIILAKSRYGKLDEVARNHEYIHTLQQREMLYLFFYLWYVCEWLVRILKYRDCSRAYRNISFEREAYEKERALSYPLHRKPWQWLKYL